MQKKSIGSKIGTIFFVIIVFICLKFIYGIYKQGYFNDFVKAEYIANISEFKRDGQVKYNKYDSYQIVSPEYNDAMFYKTVQVTPNTPYKVSCMIKTENVETQKKGSIAGAGICISDTTESSIMVQGTSQEWKKVEFIFDSKNRTEVNIGFRLGSCNDNCKGSAWFSDLKLEVGAKTEKDTHWKMVCFIVENLDVNVEISGKNEHIVQQVSQAEIEIIKDNLKRLKSTMKELSNNKMSMDYDIIEIKEPITKVTYDEENGYYLSAEDMSKAINQYIEGGNYDYIYVVAKFGNIMHREIENENDWVGLRRNGLLRCWFCKY